MKEWIKLNYVEVIIGVICVMTLYTTVEAVYLMVKGKFLFDVMIDKIWERWEQKK